MPETFVPHPRLVNGHAMTLWAWAIGGRFRTSRAESRLFQVAPDARVLAHCYWHRDRTARSTILGLHGLEGSSRAHYMRGLADKAGRGASTSCC